MNRFIPKTASRNITVYTNSTGTKYTVGKGKETPFEAAFGMASKEWRARVVQKIETQIGEPVKIVREGSFC